MSCPLEHLSASNPHGLPGNIFDRKVKNPATNLCKKIIAVSVAVFTFLAVSFAAWWGATSEQLTCAAQPDPNHDCDFAFYKVLIMGVGMAFMAAILVYRPLNERAETVHLN